MIHLLDDRLHRAVLDTFEATFGKRPSDAQIQIQTTRAEFEGDRTLVVFPSQAWPAHLPMWLKSSAKPSWRRKIDSAYSVVKDS